MEMRIVSSSFCSIIFLLFSFLAVQESSAQTQQQQQQGQQQQPSSSSCVQQLQPCLNYLDGNRDPPSSCCEPLKYVIKSEPECLCNMMSIKGANQAERSGINLTNAQQLPARCGQRINPLGCILGSPGSSSASSLTQWTQAPSMMIAMAAATAAASWMFVL